MGVVIPGGVQGAQHSGGAAMAGLVSVMLAGSLETLHVLHTGTCRAGVTHSCLRTAPASTCTSVTEQNAVTAELLTFPVLLLFCSAGGRNEGPGCAGRTGSREPLCGVGGLAELVWPAHITAVSLSCATEKPRPQDGGCSETSQSLTGKSHGFPSPGEELSGFPLLEVLRKNNFSHPENCISARLWHSEVI